MTGHRETTVTIDRGIVEKIEIVDAIDMTAQKDILETTEIHTALTQDQLRLTIRKQR
jgi:hypothetical protein